MNTMVDRNEILKKLREKLEPMHSIYAMWEGGAAAFGRVDEWSDIDLQLLCEDGRVQEVVEQVERGLNEIGSINLRYEIPQPTWHGHTQVFYRLDNASPYLLLDLVIMEHSTGRRLREVETHGKALIHFNKDGALQEESIDEKAHTERIRNRIESLRATFDMFQLFPIKELGRENYVEALQFYHSTLLRPLVELLRIRYAPARFNFHTRYLYYDLPPEVVRQLEHLFFVSDPADLEEKHRVGCDWFKSELMELQ